MTSQSLEVEVTKVGECWERTGNFHQDLLHLFETGDKGDCLFKVGSELTGFKVCIILRPVP